MKTSHLPFSPFALRDESPISCIKRAAKINGFKNAQGLIDHLRKFSNKSLQYNYLMTNSRVSQAFQSSANGCAERVRANFYSPTSVMMKRPDIIVKNVLIKYKNFRWNQTALCTKCLDEGYEKFPRDIKFFLNCPFHDCAFLFVCPFCDTKLNWKTQASTICMCGERLISPNASASETDEDRYLLNFFNRGDNEKIAAIQRILTKLQLETSTKNSSVERARRTLAIALTRQNFMMIKDAMYDCLPINTEDEIDISLTLLSTELSHDMMAKLRQQLIASITNQKTLEAHFTLNMKTLRAYIGLSKASWQNFTQVQKLSKHIGEKFKASLEEAVSLKKSALLGTTSQTEAAEKLKCFSAKQFLSFSIAKFQTGLPDIAIMDLALGSNLLGPKSFHTHRKERGAELIFEKSIISAFNNRFICSHRLSQKWSIPLPRIEQVILAHNFQSKRYRFINDTIIISKNHEIGLFKILNRATLASESKRISIPRLAKSETADYLTNEECSRILAVSPHVTKRLIEKGLIPCHCKSERGKYLISPTDVLSFRKNYFFISDLIKMIDIPSKKIVQALANAGAMPVSGPLVDGGRRHIYTKNSHLYSIIRALKQRFKYSSEHRVVLGTPSEDSLYCVHINAICKKHSISKSNFHHYFLGNRLFMFKTFRGEKYITIQDSKKIRHILKHHISITHAAEMLNVSHTVIRKLILRKQLLLNDNPFYPSPNPGLISRNQIPTLRKVLGNR